MRTRSRSSLAAGAGGRFAHRRAGFQHISREARHTAITHATGATTTGNRTFPAARRHQRPPIRRHRQRADLLGRDYELQDVLDACERDLKAIGLIDGPERDEQLAVAEAAAAPWVLALVGEIWRLERIIIRSQRRDTRRRRRVR